ncbi:hypothetical protein MCC01958_07040 [Bifidobacteriaceae bacterium MCC01958]|nr:hypothetical protein MCC01958_07040 [Bifidobacteriaceae bacterium MCC01958]
MSVAGRHAAEAGRRTVRRGRRAAGAFAASEGGYGYRRVKAMLRTRVSEKVLRSPMP